jgi:hypothetical protein
MDIFKELGFQPARLRKLNYWRLYFKVNTVSYLCNAAGTEVKICYRQQPKHDAPLQESRTSKINWPRQGRPGAEGFDIGEEA